MKPKLPKAVHSKRGTFISLQWVHVISTSYLSLFHHGQVVDDTLVFILVILLFGSVLALYRVPDSLLKHPYFPHVVVLLDTVFIAVGIALSRESAWDLFLLVFFAIFIAAIGESLVQIIVGCVILSVVFVFLSHLQGKPITELNPDAVFRIPFVFAVSILYGYIVDQAKQEKRRIRDETNLIKLEFLGVMSHELRTPLSVVLNYADILHERLLGELNSKQEKAIEKITTHARELLGMINEILHVSRIGAEPERPEPQTVNLSHFLTELRLSYDVPLEKDVKLRWQYSEELPVAKMDSEKLKHILRNLINNAIKFTEKGTVTVSASCPPHNQIAEFKVEDTGVGIPKEAQSEIFEVFQQVDGSASRSYGGVGLGLHIVKKFTEILGGTIDVQSQPGKGSRFVVRVPYETRPNV
jgi:signal transduction histidine kinase